MIKNTVVILGLSVGVLSGAFAQGSLDSLNPQLAYSATRSFSDGNMQMESAYHYAPGKHRTEMHIQGQSIVAIIREDLEVLWSLAPAQRGTKFYMEFSMQSDEAQRSGPLVGALVSDSRLAGTELVAGYSTSKYEVTIAQPDGSAYSGNIWVTSEQIPVRMEMTDGRGNQLVLEQTNIQIGPQADSLFEVPVDYSKLELGAIGGMLGNLSEGFALNQPDSGNTPDQDASRDFGFVGDVAEHATEAAKDGVLYGVGQGIRERVGGKIRGLFNR